MHKRQSSHGDYDHIGETKNYVMIFNCKFVNDM